MLKPALLCGLAMAFLFFHTGFASAGQIETELAHKNQAVVLAAGDIAKCDEDGQAPGAEATARLIEEHEGAVLALGDLVYPDGSLRLFLDCYDRYWGAFKDRTYPVPGNHGYETEGAAGYFDYWKDRAGPPGLGYYSFKLGAWRVIALNSNLTGKAFTKQIAWLRKDLEEAHEACILALWHHPLLSSVARGGNQRMLQPLALLVEWGASIVLSGHDHVYERFQPIDRTLQPDEVKGIRSFTVGTGGARLYKFATVDPRSAFRQNHSWGLLRLVLDDKRYEWSFLTVRGEVLDEGRADCPAR